jgi:hypothetical protein
MKLEKVKSVLDAKLLCGEEYLDYDVDYAFSSDLMSDVLAFASKKTLLLTGLTNAQVIRTAEMIDVSAIIFVRNKKPDAEIIKLAMENKMILMNTEDTLYAASGKLYNAGLSGIQLNNKD